MLYGRDCKFNHTAELECPFFTSGTYSVEEVEECEPFMQVHPKPLLRHPIHTSPLPQTAHQSIEKDLFSI